MDRKKNCIDCKNLGSDRCNDCTECSEWVFRELEFKEIQIRYIDGVPYYEIVYHVVGDDFDTVGYSSFDIKTVSRYIREYFISSYHRK